MADELMRIVDRFAAELSSLDEAAASARSTPAAWSIKEIVGHLIDSAANNHHRFVRAQQEAELAFPGYDQNAWVRVQDHQGRPWAELLEFWAAYNRHLAHAIRRIPAAAMAVPCRIGRDEAVTLRFLVDDYLRHLRHHLARIRERA